MHARQEIYRTEFYDRVVPRHARAHGKNVWRRFLNFRVVKEVESKLDVLQQKVSFVEVTKETSILKKDLREIPAFGPVLPRREVSPYFMGRTGELSVLKKTVQCHGSAVMINGQY